MMVTYEKSIKGLNSWLKGQKTADIKRYMKGWSPLGKDEGRAELRRRKR